MKKLLNLLLTFSLLVLLIGCEKEILPTSIEITGESEVEVGKTISLEAKVLPGNANDKTVVWASSDETILKVSDEGIVTGIKAGEAKVIIYAKANPDIRKEVIIKVLGKILPTSIEITGESEVEVDNTSKLDVIVLPINTSHKEVMWVSSNEDILTVDENGLITGHKVGKTVVTVFSLFDKSIKTSITISVKKYYNNETDSLVLGIEDVDNMFNPFYAITGPDNIIVDLTQIKMFRNDKKLNYTYGDDVEAVVKDLQIITEGEDGNVRTTYYFVLKNNIRFSNNTPLTIKDVLFNLYVYLDPAYNGPNSLKSVDILGLKDYQTQTKNISENDYLLLNDKFKDNAKNRIQALIDAITEIKANHNENLSEEVFRTYLSAYTSKSDYYKNVLSDYEKAIDLFKEEINKEYINSIGRYRDITFVAGNGSTYRNLLTTDVEAFLYNCGYIYWSKKEERLYSSFENDIYKIKLYTKEQAIEKVLDDMIPNKMDEVIEYWSTGINLNNYLINVVKEQYFNDVKDDNEVTNISGIKFANFKDSIRVNNIDYSVPKYEKDGTVKDGYNEVLSITINGIDPKAIWNFAFSVAPMYYYSAEPYISQFDYENNFGVKRCSDEFFNKVIKNADKIGVPVGAGPYAASKNNGGIEDISANEFYDKNTIYYERNPYYVMGVPIIKKINYKIIPNNEMLDNLYRGDVDFISLDSMSEIVDEIQLKSKDGYGYRMIVSSSYGYIGINAGKVPDIKVRQAIMHAINTQDCIGFYEGTVKSIYRSMSINSWAYPEHATPYYPYIGGKVPADLSVVNPDYAEYVTSLGKKSGDTLTKYEQEKFLRYLVESSGYIINNDGIYSKGSHKLSYIFTIIGNETYHPGYMAFYHAREILNEINFNISIQVDPLGLNKLAKGDLTVWAGARETGIDPDMYDIYHKNSNFYITKCWGYNEIKCNYNNQYSYENELLEMLSELIDYGRKTTVQSKRRIIYSKALDIVMQLAIELPTYQGADLYAYNSTKIDSNTFTPLNELSPYNGLLDNIHKLSLVTRKNNY
ncbi:MAG: ABC transporter substrate-binding protein [Coprobacillus sp.]|nr:ABC transporter substrate-binding protein [Coprobacillus sp.]